MSLKSDNSGAGSAGDGESIIISSYETSPRKPAGSGWLGGFGDYNICKNISRLAMNNINNSSSASSEDQESYDLKMEYLHRLALIREKLASIDIANKSYYTSCFKFPPATDNQCKITEITENKFDDVDEIVSNNNTEEIDYKKEKFEIENNCDPDNTYSALNLGLFRENEKTADNNNKDIKTIFYYGSCYNTESSAELLDLNYDPPKKKYCLRESTPKMKEGDESTKVSNNKISEKEEATGNHTKCKETNTHIFPEIIQYEVNEDFYDCNGSDVKQSPKNSSDKDNIYLLFLNTLDASHSVTPQTHRTIVTDTTITNNSSPICKRKKRRKLMRSATNKVKPVDNITLWEEIRTMEAINRKKSQESSSSKDSCFQNTLLSKKLSDPKVDLVSMSKINTKPRFPSITKLAKFCPFSKKSQTTVIKSEATIKSKENKINISKSHNEENMSIRAETLLKVKKEQIVCIDNSATTLSAEEHSEYSEPEQDIDEYFQPFCLFCFCL